MKKRPKTEKVTLATIAKALESVATKADLAKTIEDVVTKNDLAKALEGVATKVELPKISKSINDLTAAVDNLAIATNKGFENTVSKEEFGEFKDEMTDFKKKTESTLFNMDSKLQTVDQRLDTIEKTLDPLVHVSNAVQRELREHTERITHIEHKIGLVAK